MIAMMQNQFDVESDDSIDGYAAVVDGYHDSDDCYCDDDDKHYEW